MAFMATAWAQDVTVSNEAQLRNFLNSNSTSATLSDGGLITLTGGELVVNRAVTINIGNRHISGGDNSRIFNVTASGNLTLTGSSYLTHGSATDGGIIYNAGTVTISGGMGISYGQATNGGAIYNAGTLILNGGNISHCNATDGGAIYNVGELTINEGTIGSTDNPNTASNKGGGIYSTGTLTISGGSISSNEAGNGAAINLTGGSTMTMSGGSIADNTSLDDDGGVYVGSDCTFNMTGGSITGNSAKNYGGIQVDGILNMSGGSISGNTATNSYGGLRVNGSGTINMTGGSVSGNTATTHGGIYVNGTLNMTGGSVSGNTATTHGGIYVNGTLNMTGGSVTGNNATNNYGGIYVNGTLNMSGLPIVMGNLVTPTNGTETTSNVYLPSGKTITVNGAFTTGANIGITCADGENTTFTSGFGTNSPNNLAVFTSDNLSYIVTVLGNEAKLVDYNAPTISDHNVPYLNVLEDGDHGTAYRELCMKMSSVSTDNPILTQDNASGGWYVLDQNCNFNKRISIQDGDTVNLIITEYLALNANKGIDVPAGATLHIWGQSDPLLPTAATGVINSFAQENGDPGIGGSGYLYIHGGVICAIGGKNAAGIKGKSVNGQGIYGLYIYGGAVVSIGGEHGAGIGCGFSQVCGGIKITGGQVYAKGNYRAAGIGAGYHSWTCTPPSGSFSGNPSDDEFAEIRITGGDVTAIGGTGAGIGGGQAWDDWEGTPAIVYIDGGKVYASTEDGQPTNSDGAVAIGKGSRGMDI